MRNQRPIGCVAGGRGGRPRFDKQDRLAGDSPKISRPLLEGIDVQVGHVGLARRPGTTRVGPVRPALRYFSNIFSQTTRLATPVSSSMVMNMTPWPSRGAGAIFARFDIQLAAVVDLSRRPMMDVARLRSRLRCGRRSVACNHGVSGESDCQKHRPQPHGCDFYATTGRFRPTTTCMTSPFSAR